PPLPEPVGRPSSKLDRAPHEAARIEATRSRSRAIVHVCYRRRRRSSKMRTIVGAWPWSVVIASVVLGACGSRCTTTGSGGSSSPSSSDSSSTSNTSSGTGGQACDGGSCNVPPPGLLDPDYTTTWNPGILADTPTGNPLGPDDLPVRTTICASVP